MACEDCLNRRDFFAKSALAAAALVVAEACGDGQIGPPIPKRTGGGDPNVPVGGVPPFNVSKFPGLATVGVLVDIGFERAVIKTDAATFKGFSRICTHQGCDTEVVNNRFECPCHGSIFDKDGSVIRGPNIESPPITPLAQLAVTFDAATGTITIA
jgi:cytochrome b6-f complex iron-sulfur subunit